MTENISASALHDWLEDEQKPDPQLLDVREAHELALAAMPGVVHIPMGDVAEKANTLDGSRAVVCICHHGRRAQAVADWLADNGFSEVKVLVGGIQAWSESVDSSVPTY